MEYARDGFPSITYAAGEGSTERKSVGEGIKEASPDEDLLRAVVQCDRENRGPGIRSLRLEFCPAKALALDFEQDLHGPTLTPIPSLGFSFLYRKMRKQMN